MPNILDHLQSIDDHVLLNLSLIRNAPLTKLMTEVTALGSATVLALLTLVVAVALLMRRDYRGCGQLAVAGLGAMLWPWLLKGVFLRHRPTIVEHLVYATGNSFPSGHSFGAATMYLSFAFLIGRSVECPAHRRIYLALSIFIMLAVGFSRVYLGVHYATDVLVGFLTGTAWAAGINHLNPKRLGAKII